MLKAQEDSVNDLTKCIEILFKQNKVDYIKGAASFFSPNTISVQLKGGESTVEAKNIIIATGFEVAPFPGGAIEIDEEQIVSSTDALSLQKVPAKMVVIGGGIIGLEMGSVWSRLGAQVTVVEFPNSIGGACIDEEISCVFQFALFVHRVSWRLLRKQFQKSLTKQGIKFRLSTKVLSAEKKDGKVFVTTEAAKDGKQDSERFYSCSFPWSIHVKCQLEADVGLVAVGRRPYIQGLNLEKIGVEVDSCGRIVIDDQFNTSVPNIKCIGYVTFDACAQGEGRGHRRGRVHTQRAWPRQLRHDPERSIHAPGGRAVGKTEQELKQAGVKYKVGSFPFLANSRAKTNLDTVGQVKFLVEAETDVILGVHIIGACSALFLREAGVPRCCIFIIGPNAGEMIAEAVVALEYGASTEDIARMTHAHVRSLPFPFILFVLIMT